MEIFSCITEEAMIAEVFSSKKSERARVTEKSVAESGRKFNSTKTLDKIKFIKNRRKELKKEVVS